ncbi:MAG: phage integrase N-terminal SAM-like domain-containing protein, partial [Actinomycetota bacterium]|nr:phage integrase N-terminal SAM-like domain-containing protein [Actinomycetota bacterium]
MPVANATPELRAAWIYSLRAENKAPSTIRIYDDSLGRLLEFTGGRPPTRHDIRAYLDLQIRVNSPGTAVVRFRGIRSFYRWAASEGLEDPMEGIR